MLNLNAETIVAATIIGGTLGFAVVMLWPKCEKYRGQRYCTWLVDAGRAWALRLDADQVIRAPYGTQIEAMAAGRSAIDAMFSA